MALKIEFYMSAQQHPIHPPQSDPLSANLYYKAS